MNELIEIRWSERLEHDLAGLIRDKCQYQPGKASLSTIADQETFHAEFAARERTHRRAVAAIKELLQRHAQPSIDADIADVMARFQERVRSEPGRMLEAAEVTVDDSAAAARAERAQRQQANRPGGNEG
ncbi:MAG: hypothetical protein NTU84_00740 [Verrucomicrobia bacterium]|nr:hypothetical protein [Verrucomicrobiota bacterium]